MRFSPYLLLVLIFVSCKDKSIKRFKLSSAEVIDVSSKITDLETEQIMSDLSLTIFGDYLIVSDFKGAYEKGIHLFDKNRLVLFGKHRDNRVRSWANYAFWSACCHTEWERILGA